MNINAKILLIARAKGLDSEEIGEGQIEWSFMTTLQKSMILELKTGPLLDRQKEQAVVS